MGICSHQFLLIFLPLLIQFHSSSSTLSPQLALNVCKNTTNYKFCVNSLYSDPRTPTADNYLLAYISFDLAYLNATHTNDYISLLLKNATKTMGDNLKRCQGYYGKAIGVLAQAINDLDSETFFELGGFASEAEKDARECEGGFFKSKVSSPLSTMNGNLRRLCGICVVVSKLFNVS